MRPAFLRRRIREWLTHDGFLPRMAFALAGYIVGRLLLWSGRTAQGVEILSRVHRAALFGPVDGRIGQLFANALSSQPDAAGSAVRTALHGFADTVSPTPQTKRFFESPQRLLGGCMMVLKSPSENEKGVLHLFYSYSYPLLFKLFDAPAIAERYHLVIEPSWSGFCDLNVLAMTALPHPVFVAALEPRDAAFLRTIAANLVPVPVAANGWVDSRVFTPLPGVAKDVDLVMVAGWAGYKRHWAFFRALSTLRRTRQPRVALVGYRLDTDVDAILADAKAVGVDDLIDVHERLSPDEVNLVLNRSKVNVLWSRREGVNRAIVEGMAANLPCVLRAGFNYGYHYPYINAETGCYATDNDLPDVLGRMIEAHASFSPRRYFLGHLTPQISTKTLNDSIKAVATARGEHWTRDLTVRVSALDGLAYWDPADRQRFDDDYRFLASAIRG